MAMTTRRRVGFVLAALTSTMLAGAGGPAQALETAELHCELDVQHPHGSTHKDGTINVVAVTTCPIPMGKIEVNAELLRMDPYTRFTGKPKSTTSKKTAQANSAASCSEGPADFRGWAWTRITPPPGYVLTGAGEWADYGDIVGVACGVSASEATPLAVHVEFGLRKIDQ